MKHSLNPEICCQIAYHQLHRIHTANLFFALVFFFLFLPSALVFILIFSMETFPITVFTRVTVGRSLGFVPNDNNTLWKSYINGYGHVLISPTFLRMVQSIAVLVQHTPTACFFAGFFLTVLSLIMFVAVLIDESDELVSIQCGQNLSSFYKNGLPIHAMAQQTVKGSCLRAVKKLLSFRFKKNRDTPWVREKMMTRSSWLPASPVAKKRILSLPSKDGSWGDGKHYPWALRENTYHFSVKERYLMGAEPPGYSL